MYESPLRPEFSASRYSKALRKSYEDMEWLRVASRFSINEYKGRIRSRTDTPKKTRRPINALNQLVTTYLPYLSAYKVMAKIRSHGAASKAEAEFREYLTNKQLEAMEYAETDRSIGLDAIISSFGAGKVNISMGAGQFKDPDIASDFGELGFTRIAPEDMLFDPNATSIRSCGWLADRYVAKKDRLIQALMDVGMTDKANAIKALSPIHERENLVESRGIAEEATEDNTVEDEIVLWDVAIYRKSELYIGTLAHWDDASDTPEWIVEPEIYEGTERGPHIIVSLLDVPGEPIGMSVSDQMMELHLALQKIGEKAYTQIVNTKRTNTYKAGARTDADAVKKSNDDEWVQVADPSNIGEVIKGGLLAEMTPGIEFLFAMLDKTTANVNFAGGRSQARGTATGEAIQDRRVSAAFSDMRERIQKMRRSVIKRFNFWIDEIPSLQANRSLPGAFRPMELTYSNASRRSPFTDFDYDCDVVTAETLDPTVRIGKLREAVGMLGGMIQLAMSVPGGDPMVAVDIVAEEFQLPDLRNMFPSRNAAVMDSLIQQQNVDNSPDGQRTGFGKDSDDSSGRPDNDSQEGSMNTQSGAPRRPIDMVRSAMAPTVPAY